MNLFTKIDKFLRPKKYKGGYITKHIFELKKNDEIYALFLPISPIDKNGKFINITDFYQFKPSNCRLAKGKIYALDELTTDVYFTVRLDEDGPDLNWQFWRYSKDVEFRVEKPLPIKTYTTVNTWGGFILLTTDKNDIYKLIKNVNKQLRKTYKEDELSVVRYQNIKNFRKLWQQLNHKTLLL